LKVTANAFLFISTYTHIHIKKDTQPFQII